MLPVFDDDDDDDNDDYDDDDDAAAADGDAAADDNEDYDHDDPLTFLIHSQANGPKIRATTGSPSPRPRTWLARSCNCAFACETARDGWASHSATGDVIPTMVTRSSAKPPSLPPPQRSF